MSRQTTREVRVIAENVAIGVIMQRLGECRYANRYVWHLKAALTQQHASLEQKYRDAAVSVGDKLLVLEFKAPECNVDGEKIYKGIDMSKLEKIANIVGERNVLLALIHAYLAPKYVASVASVGQSSYFYLWLAVPGTTAFVPLDELPAHLKTGTIKLKVLNSIPPVNISYVNTLIPTCAKPSLQNPEPKCASCGGLYFAPSSLRTPILELENSVRVRSYTFAALMKLFTECQIGCPITSEIISELPELAELGGLEPMSTYLLVLAKGVPYLTPLTKIRFWIE
ncbi:MAG: hypothetical protein GXO43_04900 [Crenarchaeota archaeon]|nr:hypothetical protein [Thermoproteota archaeon]